MYIHIRNNYKAEILQVSACVDPENFTGGGVEGLGHMFDNFIV